jgi:hypothetical protein
MLGCANPERVIVVFENATRDVNLVLVELDLRLREDENDCVDRENDSEEVERPTWPPDNTRRDRYQLSCKSLSDA